VAEPRLCDWWLWDGTNQRQCGASAEAVEDRFLCEPHRQELERAREQEGPPSTAQDAPC
jgi:hypothetical protein